MTRPLSNRIEKVLAYRFDRRDVAAHDPLDLGHRTRPACLRGSDGTADEVRPETSRRPVERVAFGHSGPERQRREAGGTRRPCEGATSHATKTISSGSSSSAVASWMASPARRPNASAIVGGSTTHRRRSNSTTSIVAQANSKEATALIVLRRRQTSGSAGRDEPGPDFDIGQSRRGEFRRPFLDGVEVRRPRPRP